MSKTEQALRKAEEERRKKANPPTVAKKLEEKPVPPTELKDTGKKVSGGVASRLGGVFGRLFGRRKKSERPPDAAPAPPLERQPEKQVRIVMPRIPAPAPAPTPVPAPAPVLVESPRGKPRERSEEPTVAVPVGRTESDAVASLASEPAEETKSVSAGDLDIEELEHLIFIGRDKEKPNLHRGVM